MFILHFMNALKQGGPSVTVDCNNLLIIEGLFWCVPRHCFYDEVCWDGSLYQPTQKGPRNCALQPWGLNSSQEFLAQQKAAIESLVPLLLCPWLLYLSLLLILRESQRILVPLFAALKCILMVNSLCPQLRWI